MSELGVCFGISDKTILIPLKQIETEKELEKWVLHGLTKAHQQTRIECCVKLHNHHNKEEILNRIQTCDEKWILTAVGNAHHSV